MSTYKTVSNRILWPIGIGALGFLLAFLLLDGRCSKGAIGYQCINLSNRDSVINMAFQSKLALLRDSLGKIRKETSQTPSSDSATLLKVIAATVNDSAAYTCGNADTSLAWFARRFVIHRDSLYKALADPGWEDPLFVKNLCFTYIDSTSALYRLPVSFPEEFHLRRQSFPNLMDYFSGHPISALWLVISIAQMTLWFLVIPLLYGMLITLNSRLSGTPKSLINLQNWGLSSITPFVFFLLFGILFYGFIIDSTLVRDHYLLKSFNYKIKIYAIVGYVATAACFGVFLLTSMALDQLAKDAQDNNKKLADDNTLKKEFQALKQTFRVSFMITAFILSFFVLWMGVLFHAVNDTELMRLYNIYAHKDFLSYDNVYLVGAVHSLILLLFYVPVMLKFNSTQLADDDKSTTDTGSPRILNSLYKSIITLLVTASPLIAGLLQQLLSGLSGN